MVDAKNNVLTVTAPIGPGIVDTALVLYGVSSANYDLGEQTLTIVHRDGKSVFDISASSTITITVSSDVYTLAVS